MNSNDNDNSSTTGTPAGRSGVNRAVAAGLTLGLIGGTAAGLVFGVPGLTSVASSDVAVTSPTIAQSATPADVRDVPGTSRTFRVSQL